MDDNQLQPIRSFVQLRAWQEAHELAPMIYQIAFPASEQFGLTSQIRRAVVSIGSNIAEGFSRTTSKDKAQFYTIALGSLTEVQSQLLLARDLQFLQKDSFDQLAAQSTKVGKLLNGLISATRRR